MSEEKSSNENSLNVNSWIESNAAEKSCDNTGGILKRSDANSSEEEPLEKFTQLTNESGGNVIQLAFENSVLLEKWQVDGHSYQGGSEIAIKWSSFDPIVNTILQVAELINEIEIGNIQIKKAWPTNAGQVHPQIQLILPKKLEPSSAAQLWDGITLALKFLKSPDSKIHEDLFIKINSVEIAKIREIARAAAAEYGGNTAASPIRIAGKGPAEALKFDGKIGKLFVQEREGETSEIVVLHNGFCLSEHVLHTILKKKGGKARKVDIRFRKELFKDKIAKLSYEKGCAAKLKLVEVSKGKKNWLSLKEVLYYSVPISANEHQPQELQ